MRDRTIVVRNLLRKKLRFVLLLIPIACAFFLYGSLMAVRSGLAAPSDQADAARMLVINKVNFTQTVPVSYVERVAATPGVKAAAAAVWYGGYYREPRNFIVSYAVDPERYLEAYPEIGLSAAEKSSCISDRQGLFVGRTVAQQHGWRLGDTISLISPFVQNRDGTQSLPFTICGIFTDSRGVAAEATALLNYDYLNETRAFGADTISMIVVALENGANPAGVRQAIDAGFANSAHETETVSEDQFAAAFVEQFGDIGFVVLLVVGAAFCSMFIIVCSTMMIAAREKTREIGILKTVGFPLPRILRIVVAESLLLSAVGGVLGLLFAQLVIAAVSSLPALSSFAMGRGTWLSGLLWILALGLLSALVPAYRAYRLPIVEALGRR